MATLDCTPLKINLDDKDISYSCQQVEDFASKLVKCLTEDGYAVLENHGIAASSVSSIIHYIL